MLVFAKKFRVMCEFNTAEIQAAIKIFVSVCSV